MTMNVNGEHLSPKTRELLERPMEERIAHIQKDSWIPYSQANRILQQLEDLLHHPKCDRMPNLAISAQTNNGKTVWSVAGRRLLAGNQIKKRYMPILPGKCQPASGGAEAQTARWRVSQGAGPDRTITRAF